MKSLHIVEVGYVQNLILQLKRDGFNADALLKKSGLDKYKQANNKSHLPLSLYHLFLDKAHQEIGRDFLIYLCKASELHDLSDTVHYIIHKPELHSILSRGCKYNHWIISNEIMSLQIDGVHTLFKIECNEKMTRGLEWTIKQSMYYMLEGIQLATGRSWKPIEIHYQFKRPEQEDFFIDLGINVKLRYGMPHSGFVFPTSDIGLYSHRAEEEPAIIDAKLDLPKRIEYLINSVVDGYVPPISYFSDMMNISSRQLIRYLKENDTSFFEIMDNWRFKKAISEMSAADTSFKELSYKLGYANPSNFVRSFKRWTNTTPGEYQERLAI
jgi:AraC-like DNA-binding protein